MRTSETRLGIHVGLQGSVSEERIDEDSWAAHRAGEMVETGLLASKRCFSRGIRGKFEMDRTALSVKSSESIES